MRLAALIFGIIGVLSHLIGAIIAMLIGIAKDSESRGYVDFVQELIEGMGGVLETFTEGDLNRLLVMGALSLIAAIVGIVGVSFAMFKPRVAMWLLAIPSVVGLLAIIVAYHSAPGLIILASFAMVLFLWAAALEYQCTKPAAGSSPVASDSTAASDSTVEESDAEAVEGTGDGPEEAATQGA